MGWILRSRDLLYGEFDRTCHYLVASLCKEMRGVRRVRFVVIFYVNLRDLRSFSGLGPFRPVFVSKLMSEDLCLYLLLILLEVCAFCGVVNVSVRSGE